MAFKMKYGTNKKTGEGFPYKSSPNKLNLGGLIRKGLGGVASLVSGGRRKPGIPSVGGYLAGGIFGGMNSFRGMFGRNSGNGQIQANKLNAQEMSGQSQTPGLTGFVYKKKK